MAGETSQPVRAVHESPPETANLAEQLDYAADLLLELGHMMTQARLETLSGLLNLSHAEARRQAARLRGR